MAKRRQPTGRGKTARAEDTLLPPERRERPARRRRRDEKEAGIHSQNIEERLANLEEKFQKRGYDTRPIYEKHEQEIEAIREDLQKLAGQNGPAIAQDMLESLKEMAYTAGLPVDHIDKDLERRCIYCANGFYRKVLDSRNISEGQLANELRYWGISYSPDVGRWWIVFSCNYCGNVQAFHLLIVQHSNAWK